MTWRSKLLLHESALLTKASWHAERLWRRDRVFKTITFLTETGDGRRQLFDTPCVAPKDVSDVQAWAGLVADMAVDFAEAGIVRFAAAYRAFSVTKYIDPAFPDERVPGIAVEVHSSDGVHVRVFREIVGSGRQAYLAAAGPVESAADSIFAGVLRRAALAA
jgi:hypothetical protein